MESARLKRQAIRWQRQASAGDMPDELYTTLASGADGLEKRQVANLAKASNIIDESGKLRLYNDFKQDWKYDRSVFSHGMGTCGLCGKYPIREQCVLTDTTRPDTTLIVGNTCVERYVEINVDGVVLEGDDKSQYLRDNMKSAKQIFNKEKFATQYPDAMSKLKKYEDWMNSQKVINGRMRPVNPALKKMQRAMVKRLVTHGFPGPKLWKQWDQFMLDAESGFAEYQKEQENKERLRQEALAEHRERASKLAQELAKRRAQYSLDADAFLSNVEKVNKQLDDWERSTAGKVVNRIRTSGISGLSQGQTRFLKAIESRAAYERGELVISDPTFTSLHLYISEPDFLNSWESNFCKSIRNQIIEGRDLSEKQNRVLDKLHSRWSER